MSERSIHRRKRGLRLDGAALDSELTTRGLRGADLARLAEVSKDTVSRARRGEPIDRATLLKIVDALETVRVRPMLTELAPVPTPCRPAPELWPRLVALVFATGLFGLAGAILLTGRDRSGAVVVLVCAVITLQFGLTGGFPPSQIESLLRSR